MKTDRLVGIVLLLLARGRVGAQELAERFEVSPRTIYRDIDAIGMAGIPIRSVAGVGGGFEIMPEYRLDAGVFSTEDLATLLMGLTGLSRTVRGAALTRARAQVERLVPADQAADVAAQTDQIWIDPTPWVDDGTARADWDLVRTAVQERRPIRFAYVGHRGAQTDRTIEPYRLIWKGSHWYVHGYCRTRAEVRLFRLSRMAELRWGEGTFDPRPHRPPELDFTAWLAERQERIRLRVHGSVLDLVLETCAREDVTPDGPDHWLVSFPFVENDYHYGRLLALGDRCECLSPPHVRAELRRRALAVAGLYEDTEG